MTQQRAWLAMLLAAIAAPASAQTLPPACPPPVLGFAPPLDQPLLLDVSTNRPLRDGREQQFHMRYRLIFSAAPRGYRLRSTLVDAAPDGSGPVSGSVAGLLAPLVGKEADYQLSADGQTLLLQNGEALWQSVAADLLAVSARAAVAEGRQIGAIIGALPPAEREAMLSADIRQTLRFAGRGWARDLSVVPDRDQSDCALLLVTERSDPGGSGSGFVEQRQWQVDARSGLVRAFTEQRWLRQGDGLPPRLAAQSDRKLRPE